MGWERANPFEADTYPWAFTRVTPRTHLLVCPGPGARGLPIKALGGRPQLRQSKIPKKKRLQRTAVRTVRRGHWVRKNRPGNRLSPFERCRDSRPTRAFVVSVVRSLGSGPDRSSNSRRPPMKRTAGRGPCEGTLALEECCEPRRRHAPSPHKPYSGDRRAGGFGKDRGMPARTVGPGADAPESRRRGKPANPRLPSVGESRRVPNESAKCGRGGATAGRPTRFDGVWQDSPKRR